MASFRRSSRMLRMMCSYRSASFFFDHLYSDNLHRYMKVTLDLFFDFISARNVF